VEYAAKAVETSGTAVGVRCKDGVVLGFEKLIISKMLVEVLILSCKKLLANH
jgi:20S proteasome subunit alpha 7